MPNPNDKIEEEVNDIFKENEIEDEIGENFENEIDDYFEDDDLIDTELDNDEFDF